MIAHLAGLTRVWNLFVQIAGLRGLQDASMAAHFWVSPSLLLRTWAALWLIACTLIFSLRAVRICLPGIGLPLRWASILGVGTWVSTMGFHALRGLGLFNLPAALVSCSALLLLAVFGAPERAPWRWAIRREWRAMRAVARLFTHRKYLFVTSLFCAYVLMIAVRSLIIPPLGWDTITYHGPRGVHWLQTGQFTYDPGPGPYDLYRHFFSGGEVLIAWALLPFHSDLFANLATIVQWIGVGAATWALARALSVREPFAATAAGITMLLPVLAFEMGTGYVEAPLNLTLLLGIALAIHCIRRPSGPVAVAAAMAIGCAIGIKLPGAPPGIVVLAALMVRLLFTRHFKLIHRVGWVALSALVAVLPVLPWTYRAFVETGYPLSPMPIKMFGITLGVTGPALRWYQARSHFVPYSWGSETAALRAIFYPDAGITSEQSGPALGATSLIPLLAAALGAVVLWRRHRLIGAMMIGAMLAPWAAHFSAGLTIPRLYWSISVARYLIALMGIAVPVSFVWCTPNSTWAQTYRRVLIIISLWSVGISIRFGFAPWESREVMIVGVLLLLLGTLIWLVTRPVSTLLRWQQTALVLLIIGVGCSALQLRRDQTRPNAYRASFALHQFQRFWVDAVAHVDEPGGQHRIAVTGGPNQNADNWFYYFFFGSRFQNTVHYVPPTKDGRIAHFGPTSDFDKRADRSSWLSRIHERKMTEVLTFPPESLEQRWMDSLPEEFEKLNGGPDWGLYRLR